MTEESIWPGISKRLTSKSPIDLDDTIRSSGNGGNPRNNMESRNKDAGNAPSSFCFPLHEKDAIHIGIRISEPVKNPLDMAATLVAVGTERGISPVILSHLNHCDMEQFGFRIELIIGATDGEKALRETELMRFFQIGIVVDAKDLAALR